MPTTDVALSLEQSHRPLLANGNDPGPSPIAPVLSRAGERRSLKHTYNLRPDCQIDFVLPADLTAREADRLAGFIKSLPLE